MKKKLAVMGLVLLAGISGEAMAICGTAGDVRIGTAPAIRTALSGKSIHAVAPAPSNEDWKEDHCSVGAGTGPANLYKVGAGTPVDPRVKRGTWEITGIGNSRSVKYIYTGDGTYTWELWQTGANVYFCNGTTQIAHIVSSTPAGAPCP
ncbi:hypothetical protein [Methylococcus sp. EFPC2]|uniref:hypothetical protein n=1 Tax=Methylococcus sp. EFPC2 TaxID=2812648 RepID=UPI00196808DF|nr:hypothetical protein [Methylococcus sp. EFPC2]QSA96055.1 hypothetical protein JWZ97_12505 [Methylococcus sp. EFPC2]